MNAWDDLLEELESGEQVEQLVFGPFGWGSVPANGKDWELGYCEEEPYVPFEKRGVLLTAEEAKPYMKGWSFDGTLGAPECYAVYIWTNKRVIWVAEYDGSTHLDSAPRNPVELMPRMS